MYTTYIILLYRDVVTSIEAGIIADFEDFIGGKKGKLGHLNAFLANPLKLELFENPCYVIQTAHHYFSRKPETAERLLTRAYEMDPGYGAYALYYRALARLQLGHQLFIKENKRTQQNNVFDAQAKEDLTEARELTKEMCVYISAVQVTTIADPCCQLALQYGRTLELLNAFQYECNKALDRIEEAGLLPDSVVSIQEEPVGLDESYNAYNKIVKEQKQKQAEEDRKKVVVNSKQNHNNKHKPF